MRKSINLLVGLFLFVLVFSFGGLKSYAAESVSFSFSEGGGSEFLNSDQIDFEYDLPLTNTSLYYFRTDNYNIGNLNLSSYYSLDPNTLYSIDFDFSADIESLVNSYSYPNIFSMELGGLNYQILPFSQTNENNNWSVSLSDSGTYYFYGSSPLVYFKYLVCLFSGVNKMQSMHVDFSVSFSNLQILDSDSVSDYESGYNAGYSAGLSAGESQGYSNGYSDGYSAGETSGYNSGFQAGVDSVDTQSFYDAGYSSGQAAGYAAGYESGYDSGYDDAMSRVEQWGADKTIYPVEIYDYESGFNYKQNETTYGYPHDFINTLAAMPFNYTDINPNHIYCLSGRTINSKISFDNEVTSISGMEIVIDIGGKEYVIYQSRDSATISMPFNLFIPGDQLSKYASMKFKVYNAVCIDSQSNNSYVWCELESVEWQVFDYGPINNSQNETAKQTDDLTNGYDSLAGESASSTFEDNAASYEQAEANIFTSAKSDLNNFKFYDIGSDSSVLVGLSFVAATMTSIFGAMGGLSGGAGIVLSVLFSVMLVSIVIGTYRYFVSSGKTGSSGSKKGGKG